MRGPAPGILEREQELAELARLLDPSAAPQVLFLEGPAGIGKTTLLAWSADRARQAGAVVLSARGTELEREFPYGVVHQLLDARVATMSDADRATLFQGSAAHAAWLFGLADPPRRRCPAWIRCSRRSTPCSGSSPRSRRRPAP